MIQKDFLCYILRTNCLFHVAVLLVFGQEMLAHYCSCNITNLGRPNDNISHRPGHARCLLGPLAHPRQRKPTSCMTKTTALVLIDRHEILRTLFEHLRLKVNCSILKVLNTLSICTEITLSMSTQTITQKPKTQNKVLTLRILKSFCMYCIITLM